MTDLAHLQRSRATAAANDLPGKRVHLIGLSLESARSVISEADFQQGKDKVLKAAA